MAHRYRGKSLKDLRERMNIKLRRVADETRITTWYLAGIEEERFDRFPGKFYFKAFAGQYARHLGLDDAQVVRDLQNAYDAWEEEKTPATPTNGVSITDGSLLGLLNSRLKNRTPEV
jgi:cytoskeletal protein RodZ